MPKSLLAVVLLVLVIAGCTSPTADSSTGPSGAAESPAHGEHGEHAEQHAHDEASGKTDMEKMEAALAQLLPEDAESAAKQHFCPVSGEMLGTMGTPHKVEVNGQAVWICCDGCKRKLLDNPDHYLARLK